VWGADKATDYSLEKGRSAISGCCNIAGVLGPVVMLINSSTGLKPPTETKRVAVFVHGAGAGGWEWHAWLLAFEKNGWICVNPDLKRSPKGVGATRFEDYLRQVEIWGRSQQPCKLAIIGASMGGVLALKASESLHPSALVLVNSVGPSGIGKHKARSWPEVIQWSRGTLQDTKDSMPDSDSGTIGFAFKHWRDESGAVLQDISNGIPVETPRCPVLVVLGDKDTDVPNSIGVEMANRYHGDLKIYKGMSHVGPLLGTRAVKVSLETLDWLNKHVR